MGIVIFIGGLLFGLFAFSQIVYPVFSAWPRARKLEREGKLIRPIPISTFLIAPVIWGILVWVSAWAVGKFFPTNLSIYYLSLGIIFLIVLVQIPKQNRDLELDFQDTWKQYLKEQQEDLTHSRKS
ncbi:MAG: hypothetical protein HYX84_06760 [Chloroflexi bacterium]|nr:hypothetical protein [Chloroflexota bacterium]